ncbi:MAG TPA: alpha/beta hydrolase [Myxococcota bacterium]|nr:alpha/beta hydrolase [Myxococcota bacterium]
MSEIRQHRVKTNGIELHVAEAGEGPLVLLCHGFPESWYSWRHQLPALAAAGYRAVAPDMRGYGKSDAPKEIDRYTIFHLVGDMIGLVDALGARDFTIVGHDWGSIVAWTAALIRPDRVRGVVGVSVPFFPRGPLPPTQMFKALAGDNFMYILYFQEPGKAERELDRDPARTMRTLLYSASGSLPREALARAPLPKTAGFLDAMVEPPKLPSWLSQADLDFYTAEFARAGFRGGLNWYRNFDRNWELLAPFADSKVTVPSAFIGGLRDVVVTGPDGKEPGPMVQMLPSFCTDFRGSVFLPDAGHWTQQEEPAGTNKALLEFLASLGLRK